MPLYTASIIRELAETLSVKLKDHVLQEAYTLNKNELLLIFRKDSAFFTIRLLTKWRQGWLFFGEEDVVKTSNAQSLFEALYAKQVQQIRAHNGNRSFEMNFGNGDILVFKMYDGLSNVICFHEGNISDLFRDEISNDHNLKLPDFDKAGDDLSEIPVAFSITRNDSGYEFHTTGIPGALYASGDPAEILTYYSRLSTSLLDFSEQKNGILQRLKSREKHLLKVIEKSKSALRKIEEEISPEETGHIIMANLHLIKTGLSVITLNDFYRNTDITIPLKKDLNAQENAAYYYRKARNRKTEISELRKKTGSFEAQLLEVAAEAEKVNAAQDKKSLRPFLKQIRNEEKEKSPFKVFEKEGWEILAGKNAANNDLLTMKHAHKNDLWLHAREVTGSHVIIRNKGGKPFPANIIAYAAGIAAYYSKAKGSGIVPVSYTIRKFVRKPKGSEPGQVVLDKEEVIMTEPGI